MSSVPVMIRLVSSAVAVANRAGQICRDVMKSGSLGLVDKGYNDPQTEADRKAQRCIVNSLANKFPGITIYGEENLEPSDEDQLLMVREEDEEVLKKECPEEFIDLDEKDVVVWVDPLDGTAEYTEGLMDCVTVLIGIAVKGEPVGGVVHKPFYTSSPETGEGHTYWALKGLGAHGVNVTTQKPPSNTEEMRIVCTRSHYSDLIHQTVEALKPKETLRMGGCGNKSLMVAEGKVDAYVFPSPGTKKWDTCAVDAIVREVGGVMTDVNGRKFEYGSWEGYRNSLGLVVTMCKDVHQIILDKIPQKVKDKLEANATAKQQ